MSYDLQEFEEASVAPQPSCAKRLLVGSLGILAICFIVCGGLGFLAYRFRNQSYEEMAKGYVERGYSLEAGQVLEVRDSSPVPQVFAGQTVTILSPLQADAAIFAQVAEIQADIHGNLDFGGQVLTIRSAATIHGNLLVRKAQTVQIDGKVLGDIQGNYQSLFRGP